MKKSVIVLLALLLALPAVSFAGSATSRWDMTIGGYVKFDMGWGSQSQGQDASLALRQGNASYDNYADQTSNFYMYSGETRVNMLTKGPDAWGAKTSAFIEGHFRGDNATGANNTQGSFNLRHAFMQFDWANTKLIIGQTWQKWGLLPTFANTLLEYNGIGPFLKGSRQPLVRVEQTFANNWNWSLGAISPVSQQAQQTTGQNGIVNGYSQSQMPFFEGSFGWTTDKCGKIGPWQMLFNLEGFYGRQKLQESWIGAINRNPVLVTSDKEVDAWGIAFKGFIPIIPERKGDKKGALSASGVIFYTQNPGWFQGPVTTSTYDYYPTSNYFSFHSPVTYGGWGQLSYYITDKFYANGWFGYMRNNLSNYAASLNPDAVQNTTQYILNLSYDVNAAIRFGLEGAYFNTRYAGYTSVVGGIPVTQKDGNYWTVRVGAFYFF